MCHWWVMFTGQRHVFAAYQMLPALDGKEKIPFLMLQLLKDLAVFGSAVPCEVQNPEILFSKRKGSSLQQACAA